MTLDDEVKLLAVRYGPMVKRFHTQPHLAGKQDVGQHSFGVAMLILTYCPNQSHALLAAALCHDMAEQFIADVPAPVKWRHPDLSDALEFMEEQALDSNGWVYYKHLTDYDRLWLKVCDKLEGILFCLDQLMEGNRGAAIPASAWIQSLPNNLPEDLYQLTDMVVTIWNLEASKQGITITQYWNTI